MREYELNARDYEGHEQKKPFRNYSSEMAFFNLNYKKYPVDQ